MAQILIDELVTYDPSTGLLYRKTSSANGVQVGDIAGGKNASGYVMVSLHGKKYPAHRIAWRLMTGKWPKHFIDHRNLNRADNRWDNLREATPLQNNANCPKRKSALAKGVTRHRTGRFQAQIKVNGRNYYLGLFDTVEEAGSAYANKAQEMFGEYARTA